ncbi:sulfite exporter TauE/SafE family protein [Parvularcula sp. LCG005]|uniref:sulfite exporter TauE/SafE family protein n=1 Tax=Parvularcula sp. LCG005 TaxID=3078805 RepID=UPI002942D1BB|nr:sulfite exporter TauE/SafE family protein [Parvularcula sp. LCG005]WOI52247.1 sulfite exporter TauE/SafE family protein [Parvularcula sp. LCG005]
MTSPRWLRPLTIGVLSLLMISYVLVWWLGPVNPLEALRISYFMLIGVFGASIANSTGTGGGVVFIPAFSIVQEAAGLSLTTAQIVAISFVIQSFGMTIGSLTWINRLYKDGPSSIGVREQDFFRIIGLVVACCLPVLWLTQAASRIDAQQLLLLFKSFSIVLGSLLLLSVFRTEKGTPPRQHLSKIDWIALAIMGAAGGLATALFSVGVGEFVALYLFIRGFSLNTSVATAVVISAITVIAGVPLSILNNEIVWEIIAVAAPGVVIGGYLGRRIAQSLGARRLKLMASLWIIGSCLFLITRALGLNS